MRIVVQRMGFMSFLSAVCGHKRFWPFKLRTSVLNPEIFQNRLVVVLCVEAGVAKVAGNVRPVPQATVVEHFQVICYDERHYPVAEALLEHQKSSDSAVPVLKRVD